MGVYITFYINLLDKRITYCYFKEVNVLFLSIECFIDIRSISNKITIRRRLMCKINHDEVDAAKKEILKKIKSKLEQKTEDILDYQANRRHSNTSHGSSGHASHNNKGHISGH